MGIAHFEDAPALDFDLGHLRGRWTELGRAAGSERIGLRKISVPKGAWSTPAHEHGREEEIFYVLSGRGLSWQGGQATEIGEGDCIVYLPRRGAHTLHAIDGLELLAFGPREHDEAVGFPRLGMSLVGRRGVDTLPGTIEGVPIQFVRESGIGPPEVSGRPAARPATIVNVQSVQATRFGRSRIAADRRNLGRAAGSIRTGLQHVEVQPGKESAPPHCHSQEEEMFVILDGEGRVILGDEQTPVRSGHVISRPAGTGVTHQFRAGETRLSYLAYGTREPGDMCYYPRSNKISFRGLGVIGRIERLDYWEGED